MSGDISAYQALVTSEHASKPNFMASLAASIQPVADTIAVLQSMPAAFDVDEAVGAQLDVVGLWVGANRQLSETLNLYFSFDTPGLGYDQGDWYEVGDSTTSSVTLGDDDFRTLIRAKIAANQWDGTIPGAYAIWADLFPAPAAGGSNLIIIDGQDMTMQFAAVVDSPTAVETALASAGYIILKPAGVSVTSTISQALDTEAGDGLVSESGVQLLT